MDRSTTVEALYIVCKFDTANPFKPLPQNYFFLIFFMEEGVLKESAALN